MENNPKKRSSSLDRRVEGYLKPTNHNFLTRYIETTGCTKSAAVNEAVRALRDKLAPPVQKTA